PHEGIAPAVAQRQPEPRAEQEPRPEADLDDDHQPPALEEERDDGDRVHASPVEHLEAVWRRPLPPGVEVPDQAAFQTQESRARGKHFRGRCGIPYSRKHRPRIPQHSTVRDGSFAANWNSPIASSTRLISL